MRVMALEKSIEIEETNRKIEFHVSANNNNNKQCNGFGNGFKLLTLNPNASGSDHFETGFDPELSFKITYRRIGAGLRNLGNTCFLNSVLQCLTYTEPLAAYLQSGKHQNSCHTAGFCALCAIQKHVSRALQSTGRILEPKDLVSNLRRISRNFRNARQEDAHEYMVNLLESMHKCCLPSGVPSESPNAYEKSLVHKIFGGRLRSQVKCMQCSYCSNKFDPFLDLSLEIYKADSLYKALAHFTAKEELDGGSKQYQCQQCNQKVKALKQLTIYKPPNVLTIHLKRFGSYMVGQKINKNVAFGPNLDLKHFVTGPYDGNLKYTLYGVLVHAGWSTRSGHYYCFVRTSSGMWYTLDDNEVYQVSEKKVLAQKAYMLFYVRDRGNTCAKKPVNDNHKDNIARNANGTAAAQTKLNPEIGVKAQNVFVEKKDSSSSSTLKEIDASKDIPSKTLHLENANGNIDVVCPEIKQDPQTESPLEDRFTATTNSAFREAESSSTVEASEASPILGHNAKMVDCNDRTSGARDNDIDNGNKNQIESADKPPSSGDLCTGSGVVSMITGSSSALAVRTGTIEETLFNIDGINSTKKVSIEKCKVGIFPRNNNSNSGVSIHVLPDKAAATEQLSCAVKKINKPKLKLKRKFLMYQITSMPLSSNLIFGATFAMQKKHKRRKCHALQNKSRNTKPMSETSEKVKPGSYDDKHCKRVRNIACGNAIISSHVNDNEQIQRLKSSYDDEKTVVMHNSCNGGIISNDVTDDNEQRLKMDKTVVLCETPKSTRESRQTNIFSILTRGLEENTVARWDDIEVSPSEKAEVRRVKNERIIGYAGDDWDEEYDRGKRKKIKSSKISFGTQNLFQELASRKDAKRKRAKLQ